MSKEIQINSLEGITLHTEGKYCAEDIKLTLDPSFRQPKGNLEITANGIEDVSSYATVTINVPTSSMGEDIAVIDIDSTAAMNNALSEENIGKIYRYTGETNFLYVNGALYQVTEV
jgi:hypothetical protein